VTRWVVACALLAGALPLGAQDISATLGVSRVRYADSLDGTAGAVGARLAVGRGLRAATLDGAFSRFDDSGWAVQVSGQGSLLWPVARAVSLGLAAGAAVNQYEGGTPSGTAAAGPLLAVRTGRVQTVVGASLGAYRTIDSVRAGLASGALHSYWFPAAGVSVGGGVVGSLADTLRFADLTLHLRFATYRVRAGVLGGVRAGDLSDRPWGSLDLAWDVIGPVTFEAAAGRYPQDITGFTDGLYAQAGLRVYALHASRPPPRPAVRVRRIAHQRVRVELRHHGTGDTLYIAGDWNGWSPVPLEHQGGDRWRVELALAPGAYAFALRDGERWVLPRDMRGVDDGFGGVVGTLLVGR
jgi:hypothetical protein